MKQSNNSLRLNNLYIHICLNNIQIRHNNQFQDVYFSVVYNQKFHFSSAISSKTSYINDDFFIFFQTEEQIPQILKIQRWEKHMILLQHQIDIIELKARNSTKKKLQTKQNQIISLTINLFNKEQIGFRSMPISSIAQHYIKINDLIMHESRKPADDVHSYFQVQTKEQKYIIPVINSEVVIQLPTQFRISYFEDGQLFGKSHWLASRELNRKTLEMGLYSQKGKHVSKFKMNLQWGTNFSYRKISSVLLYEAHQLCIYDIQLKFQNFPQLANARLKFVYGTKVFQLNGQLNHRVVQIQKIIFMLVKSEQEQILVYCQKNNKIYAQAKFNTTQMVSHKVLVVKKHFTDPVSHRTLGYIKFECEMAKNLSLPSSNSFWRQCYKKKNPSKLILKIQQLSVYSQSSKKLMAVIKTQKEQYQVDPVVNFSYFDVQNQIHQPLVLSIQQKSSVYILIKEKTQLNKPESDFLGIASINYEELRLGVNSIKLPFYKNQVQTLYANFVINKVVLYPFVKGIYQPQILVSPHPKYITISASIQNIQFEPYFQTYEYERKSQIYCILQVGRLKKVIILQLIDADTLRFQVSIGSDSLNYALCQSDYIRAKITFLVSQLGVQQQIYGYSLFRLKTAHFAQNQTIKLNQVQIKNDYGICVGSFQMQFRKGLANSSQILSNQQIQKIKNDMVKVKANIVKMQKNLSKNKPINDNKSKGKQKNNQKKQFPVRYVSKKNIQAKNIKLPKI